METTRQPPQRSLGHAQVPDARLSAYDARSFHYGYGMGGVDDDSDSIDILAILTYLLRYRWMIAILLVIGMLSGLMITWMLTPQYRATAKLEIMVPSARVFQDMGIVSEAADLRDFETAAEKLKSRALAQRVVYELGLTNQPEFLFPNPSFAFSNVLARAFNMPVGENLDDYTPEALEKIAVDRIQSELNVQLIRNTSLLAVTYSNQVPRYAADVSNQLARSFIDQTVDQTSETSDLARQFIQEQVLQVKKRLQESEKQLVDYAKEQGITVTGDEKSLIASNIETMNAALAEAIQQRLEFGRLVEQIKDGQAESLPQVIDSVGISRMREKVAELSAEYQQKLATFKPQFPEMQKLSAQITEMKRQIDNAIRAVANTVEVRFEEAKAKEDDLRAKMAELESEQSAYQDKNIQYTILKREVDSNRSQYDTLISKLNEVGVSSELRNQNAAIIDAAVVPDDPYFPRLPVNLALALVMAAVVAAALIYILELLNNTFTNPDQIEAELKLPVLGILPRVDGEGLSAQLADQRSALSEAYRSLRTALQFTGNNGAPRSLLIASSEPAEGKSTTAIKLAKDFGILGVRVLLIDADLRKPSLHRVLGMSNVLGLSNALSSNIRREDVKNLFRQTEFPNVKIMTAGTIPPNPADLLSSSRMGLLVNSCQDLYDLVIVDGPPVLGLADALILSRLVETTLLVVSANQVTRKSARDALKRVRSAGGLVAGAALSKFEIKRYEYNYAYKYMSYQYHTYGHDAPQLTDSSDGSSAPTGKDSASAPSGSFGTRMRRMLERVNRFLYRSQ